MNNEHLESGVAAVLARLTDEAAKLATSAGTTRDFAYEALAHELATHLTPAALSDKRRRPFKVRVRLYDAKDLDTIKADTDPDVPVDGPGALVLHGLPAVCAELADLAAKYHGKPCVGLELSTLRWRLNGLRPTLSRRKHLGNATWRVDYIAPDGATWKANVVLHWETEHDASAI